MPKPIRVAVTGAAGQIAYNLIFEILNGDMLGAEQPVSLSLLEIPVAMEALRGLAMEIEDCAFPLLAGLELTSDPAEAFKDVDWALLVGSKPRGKGMERNDLIRENGPIFVTQGKALEKASPSVRILVVGNPCNTNCLIAMRNAPSIPRDRWFAMTRLDHNRGIAQLAAKARRPVTSVTNMTIWGNHSATQFPDFVHARIDGKPAADVIGDRAWLEGDFISRVQKRGAEVIEARGKSSAASAAHAALSHVRTFVVGTPSGDWTSAAVASDGSYGIREGLIASFPVRASKDGRWEIVQGLELGELERQRISKSVAELESERDVVKDLLG